MGAKSPSGGVEMVNSISNRQGMIPLILNEDIYVLKNTNFFFYYRGGEVENAGKEGFMRMYNGDKRGFDQFVKMNKIDFNRRGDLEKLFHFCTLSKM